MSWTRRSLARRRIAWSARATIQTGRAFDFQTHQCISAKMTKGRLEVQLSWGQMNIPPPPDGSLGNLWDRTSLASESLATAPRTLASRSGMYSLSNPRILRTRAETPDLDALATERDAVSDPTSRFSGKSSSVDAQKLHSAARPCANRDDMPCGTGIEPYGPSIRRTIFGPFLSF